MQPGPENPSLTPPSSHSRPRLLILLFGTLNLILVCCSFCVYASIQDNSLSSLFDRIQSLQDFQVQTFLLSWSSSEESEALLNEREVPRRFNIIEELKNHTKRFNFANSNSGAKISQKSKEMLQSKAILTDDPDTYLMTPNNQHPKYFVISLSQDIQIETVMLLSQERYSSRVKHFALYGSREDPSENWIPLGLYQAERSNLWQGFSVAKKKWVRHVKFQIESVFDPREYYCIITQIKVFGSSLMQGIKEDLSLISRHPEETNLTKTEKRLKDAQANQVEMKDSLLTKEQEELVESICPNQVSLSSLLNMNSSTLGLSQNKANYLRKFQELKLQISQKRTQLKAITESQEDSEDEESVFKQLAQSLDDMKIYHYLLEQFLLVDFAEALQSKLRKVQIVEDQILKAVNQSNEDEVNLVVHSVQKQAEKVKVQLIKENQNLQQQIFVFEVIVILLLVLVLVISLQTLERKKAF